MTAPSEAPPPESGEAPPESDLGHTELDHPAAGTGATGPAGAPQPVSSDPLSGASRWWARHVWWVSLVVGCAGFAYVWLATPHQREIDSVWHLAAKVVTFGFVCLAIAFFPGAGRRAAYLLLFLPFIFFTAYLYPRMGYFYFLDTELAEAGSWYTHQFLLSYPGIVLTAASAYRLGGGSPGRCLKIAANGMLVIFSGLLDYMWWLVNPVDIPEVIDAPHITILTGGPIPYGATVLFIAAHVPVLAVVNLLPLDRWIRRLVGAPGPAS